jgi:drug/metabolite transporter (DMT)-like permease
MPHLIAASLIWAFSFGMIKRYLGGLDPLFVAFARIALSTLVFLPFFRLSKLRRHRGLWPHLAWAGAIEYGVMYISYLTAYRYLPAWQVALFTVFTPVLVWLIHGIYERKLMWQRALPACFAVLGAGFLSFRTLDGSGSVLGFILVQISNGCFAWGQLHYRRAVRRFQLSPKDEREVFATLYGAALILTGLANLMLVDLRAAVQATWTTPGATLALLYSGIVASGLAFFLWNRGATQAQPSVLAVLNNLKAPLAMAVAVLVFREQTDITQLLTGFSILALGLGTAAWIERPVNHS